MTKTTYRELEALAVDAVKRGLVDYKPEELSSGVQVLKLLHEIRFGGTGFHDPIEDAA